MPMSNFNALLLLLLYQEAYIEVLKFTRKIQMLHWKDCVLLKMGITAILQIVLGTLHNTINNYHKILPSNSWKTMWWSNRYAKVCWSASRVNAVLDDLCSFICNLALPNVYELIAIKTLYTGSKRTGNLHRCN